MCESQASADSYVLLAVAITLLLYYVICIHIRLYSTVGCDVLIVCILDALLT